MKKLIYVFLALFLVACGSDKVANLSQDTVTELSSPKATVQSILSSMDETPYIEGQLLVKFKSGVSSAESSSAIQSTGASVARSFNIVPELKLIKLPDGMSVSDAVIQYMSDPNVEYAEPNYIMQLFAIPNDTYFHQQWALDNQGAHFGGSVDADIDAPEAWDIFTGTADTVMAIIDSGINYNHEDLVGSIWQNEDEGLGDANSDGCPGVCGIDDDGDTLIDENSAGLQPWEPGYINDLVNDDDENGYIDDLIGWDFVGSDITAPVEDPDPMDELGHGTHVAGIVAGRGNNNTGIAGVNWRASLMALKVGDSTGGIATSAAVDAIDYAVANNASVINASFGGSTFSSSMFDAISTANDTGVLFVAAAGNGGGVFCNDGVANNNDLSSCYPASYNLSNIISVAATDQNDWRVSFSNYGPKTVHLAAPGVYNFSTVLLDTDYGVLDFMSGTSMAAPHVTGVAGLLKGFYPTFTNSQIRSIILDTVEVKTDLIGWVQKNGRLNAYTAIAYLLAPIDLSATGSTSTSITLSWTNRATRADSYKVERKVSGGIFNQIDNIPSCTMASQGIESTPSCGMTYTDTGLTAETSYTYRLKPYNSMVDSPFYSNEESASTPKTPEPPVIEKKSSDKGESCSIGARQNIPTSMAGIAIMLIPLAFIAILRRKRKHRG